MRQKNVSSTLTSFDKKMAAFDDSEMSNHHRSQQQQQGETSFLFHHLDLDSAIDEKNDPMMITSSSQHQRQQQHRDVAASSFTSSPGLSTGMPSSLLNRHQNQHSMNMDKLMMMNTATRSSSWGPSSSTGVSQSSNSMPMMHFFPTSSDQQEQPQVQSSIGSLNSSNTNLRTMAAMRSSNSHDQLQQPRSTFNPTASIEEQHYQQQATANTTTRNQEWDTTTTDDIFEPRSIEEMKRNPLL